MDPSEMNHWLQRVICLNSNRSSKEWNQIIEQNNRFSLASFPHTKNKNNSLQKIDILSTLTLTITNPFYWYFSTYCTQYIFCNWCNVNDVCLNDRLVFSIYLHRQMWVIICVYVCLYNSGVIIMTTMMMIKWNQTA